MVDIVTLRGIATAPGSGGKAEQTVASTREVYADVRSVKRAEFYAAESAGQTLDVVLVVNGDEYDGQKEVQYAGTIYTVTRAYQVGLGRVELSCARR